MTYIWQTMMTIFVMAMLITLVLTPVTIKLAPKIHGVDIPKDNRRMHDKPIPRVGGIAMFVGVTAAVLQVLPNTVSYLGILGGGAVIFIFGLVDDIVDLRPVFKLAGQVLGAVIVYLSGTRIEFLHFFSSDKFDLGTIVGLIVTVLWLVGITNAINLIDGMDGLAAGVVAIASLCIAYVAYIHGTYAQCMPLLAVAGAGVGFLPWNFYPAKTFMGDCGSQYLGFMIASFSITGLVKSATLVALVIPFLVLGLPLLDTAYAIIRRVVRKQGIMHADKEHIHHSMAKTGMGQRRSVIIMYGLCTIMGTAAVLFSRGLYVECTGLFAMAIVFIYIIITDRNHMAPKVVEEVIENVEEHLKKKDEDEDTGIK